MKIAAVLAAFGLLLIAVYFAVTSGVDFSSLWQHLWQQFTSSIKPGLRVALIIVAVLLAGLLGLYALQRYPGSPISLAIGGVIIFIMAAGHAYDNFSFDLKAALLGYNVWPIAVLVFIAYFFFSKVNFVGPFLAATVSALLLIAFVQFVINDYQSTQMAGGAGR